MTEGVGIGRLRRRARTILRRAAGGESVVITDQGHPIARIVPFRASILEQLVAEGRVTPADGDLLVRLDELGLPGKVVGTEPSKALEELRADEA